MPDGHAPHNTLNVERIHATRHIIVVNRNNHARAPLVRLPKRVKTTRTTALSHHINGYETDHCGAPYDAGDALDFIFKWYGTCTRHTITRP